MDNGESGKRQARSENEELGVVVAWPSWSRTEG